MESGLNVTLLFYWKERISRKMFHKKNTYYESKLENKQKIIDRLIQENNELREQIAELDPESIQKKLELAESAREEYEKLIDELKLLKEEYKEINRQMKMEKKALIKELKELY